MNATAACIALLVVTIITSFCADYLVGTIDTVAQEWHLPKSFIGLILLPLVANAAEHVTSVWMASKGKMPLAIGVSIGSSIVGDRLQVVWTLANLDTPANRSLFASTAPRHWMDHWPASDALLQQL